MLFTNTLMLCFPWYQRPNFMLYKTIGKIMVLHIIIFTFLGRRWWDKYSEFIGIKHYLNTVCS
jgi:hypothetical protein